MAWYAIMYCRAGLANLHILTVVITSSDRQWQTLALKQTLPLFFWRLMFWLAPFVHAHRYSIPSPASSAWQLGVKRTLTPRPFAICCIIPSSFKKSVHIQMICRKLVLLSTVPGSSFFPVSEYLFKLVLSIKPRSQRICNNPLGFPSHPYFTFATFLVVAIWCCWHNSTNSRLFFHFVLFPSALSSMSNSVRLRSSTVAMSLWVENPCCVRRLHSCRMLLLVSESWIVNTVLTKLYYQLWWCLELETDGVPKMFVQ